MKTQLSLLALGAVCLATTACSSGAAGSRTPDEFRVVTKSPLIVPPEYSLRPPGAGQSLPAEVEAAKNDNAAAFGSTLGVNASASERALVAAADANAVSPMIRTELDYEEFKTIRKSPSVADRIMFWRKDNAEDAESAAADNATGNEPVTIESTTAKPRVKLPGT
ncbi:MULTISPECIES: DUF3035 domain-containing protein [unclassified Hyphomonas]|jgi:hypothetical protein|uniref:DUF3035 domain-containing protein n=1 Tax=unclassified Hyphomonas TaxID=2630699 RepID=UPI0004590836|nr:MULTISPECIES: DUF3035 domain-containing protein [unclassified Hyphomonas]KCZ47638.1 hypothetical protein HY17_03970 [Hyphomonas sp. CY54-11-8]RAN39527.1 hypothetical protein HY26_02090 [Hyphomonas sp. GM-8P]